MKYKKNKKQGLKIYNIIPPFNCKDFVTNLKAQIHYMFLKCVLYRRSIFQYTTTSVAYFPLG